MADYAPRLRIKIMVAIKNVLLQSTVRGIKAAVKSLGKGAIKINES